MVGEELVGYDAVSGRRRQSPSEIDFFVCRRLLLSAIVGDLLISTHSLCPMWTSLCLLFCVDFRFARDTILSR